jgi:hypothetical protein
MVTGAGVSAGIKPTKNSFMKSYIVKFIGSQSRLSGFTEEVEANNEREAVEKVYSEKMNSNYFPQDDGSIKDCDGWVCAEADSDIIEYDGGYFEAVECTYDVIFNDSENSDSKGFEATSEFCRKYIDSNNGTNESYFADYIGGTVCIKCNQTGDEFFETKVIAPKNNRL